MTDPSPTGGFQLPAELKCSLRPRPGTEASEALEKSAKTFPSHRLAARRWIRAAIRPGGAESIVDRRASPPLARRASPTDAGINTFMERALHRRREPRRPILNGGEVLGAAPSGFPGHSNYPRLRPPRFGPQGMSPYLGPLTTPTTKRWAVDTARVDQALRCGDIYDSRATTKRVFDQISKGCGRTCSVSGAFPIILGGDHSIGFPSRARRLPPSGRTKKVGIIALDRHVDSRRRSDLSRRAHAHLPLVPCPTNMANLPPPRTWCRTGHTAAGRCPRRGEGLP